MCLAFTLWSVQLISQLEGLETNQILASKLLNNLGSRSSRGDVQWTDGWAMDGNLLWTSSSASLCKTEQLLWRNKTLTHGCWQEAWRKHTSSSFLPHPEKGVLTAGSCSITVIHVLLVKGGSFNRCLEPKRGDYLNRRFLSVWLNMRS